MATSYVVVTPFEGKAKGTVLTGLSDRAIQTYLRRGLISVKDDIVTNVTDAGALTSTVAAGTAPTKAEFDALRADVDSLRTKLNALLADLRT